VIATLLRVEVLVAGYGRMPILHGVSLLVAHGELAHAVQDRHPAVARDQHLDPQQGRDHGSRSQT